MDCVNTVGQQELFKLNYYQGGVNFRIPTVGAKIIDGKAHANIQLPGMQIRYTTDGTEPTMNSPIYSSPVPVNGKIHFRAFDSKGRGSRIISIDNN
jgi:hexosaminidase